MSIVSTTEMTNPVAAAAVNNTQETAIKEDLFEKKGARWAQYALICLMLAIFLIFIGVYFNIRSYPKRKWLMVIWIVGILFFLAFAFFVYQQNKIISCMKDDSQDGCLARIGQDCGAVH
jgi:Na+/proline symporter